MKSKIGQRENKRKAMTTTEIWKQKSGCEVLFAILKWVNNLAQTYYV